MSISSKLIKEIAKNLDLPDNYDKFSYYFYIAGDRILIVMRRTNNKLEVSRVEVELSNPQLIKTLQEFLNDAANKN